MSMDGMGLKRAARYAAILTLPVFASAVPQVGHGGDWPPELDCACNLEQLIVNDPMLTTIDAYYPEITDGFREKVVTEGNRGPDRESYEMMMRPRLTRLVNDLTPVASVDNTWRLIELQREEALTAQPFSAQACAEVLSPAGLVGFISSMVTLDQYQAREDALIVDLVRQAADHPETPPPPLSDAEKAAFNQAALERLPADQRAAAEEALRHPGEATARPYADASCRYGLAQREALLAMPREEGARVYKGLR